MNNSNMTKTVSPPLMEQVRQAVTILRDGGIVAYPTDTVYGLGADIFNDAAVKRVFAAKDRPLSLPFPVLISDSDQLEKLVTGISPFSAALMKKFWPGGLTIIFTKALMLQSLVLAGSDKIGVRIPDHDIARLMIRELGRPVVGTSANLHTGSVALTADDVKRQIGNRVDFVIDAGPCPGGTESTVVDITSQPPAIVRQGAIPSSAIMAEYRERGNE
jgi:L-threonylcarbamoyladenylate synthase